MPLFIIQNDICTMPTDAIVNAANSNLNHGGGVAASIARAAGEEQMAEASAKVAPCPTGSAVFTPGFDLPAKYVIHAVGPIWQGGDQGEEELLRSAYRSSLELARDLGCRSLAFPLISAGIFGYPRDEAFQVAVETIEAFLEDCDMTVYLVLYASTGKRPSRNLQAELDAFIDRSQAFATEPAASGRLMSAPMSAPKGIPSTAPDGVPDSSYAGAPSYESRHEERHRARERKRLRRSESKSIAFEEAAALGDLDAAFEGTAFEAAEICSAPFAAADAAAPLPKHMVEDGLTSMLEHLDASFSDTVFSLIDAKGLTDPEVYNKVHMSRQSFSKLRQPGYHPKKTTAIVLALALELDLVQTQELLARAGYTLTTSSKQDCVVMFLIRNGIHDLAFINELLYERDLPLLSS